MKEKVPPKIVMSPIPGLILFPLVGNGSAICSSRSEVRDEMSATILMVAGSYFSRGKFFSSCGTRGIGNSFQKLTIWGRVFDGAKMKNLDFQVYFG